MDTDRPTRECCRRTRHEYRNHARVQQVEAFNREEAAEEYSTGTAELKGCTTMYIISHKGVYATHWWENVSFDPDKDWKPKTTTTTAEMFQDTVIDVLEKGGNYHPRLGAATLIEDDYIKALLTTCNNFIRQFRSAQASMVMSL
ncbi:hypothetical protein BKA65DRAFT_286006 [Rhexocercosporidium sp. MPI-PUGE-AT-0058]|nr:hypothetical protein BKA65DRAFT_286006 [Rhexocercosporidium sp. MPI-PUGE-AT-0058]